MEKLLEHKENTFPSIHTGRPIAERLSSGYEQRPNMASIWQMAEPLLLTADFKVEFTN
jgi:hypothetical protein